MASLKTMRENLATLVAKGREVVEAAEKEGRGLSAEDRQAIDKIDADAKALIADIKAIDNLRVIGDQSDAFFSNTHVVPTKAAPVSPKADKAAAITDDDRRLAISAWFLNQPRTAGAITDTHRAAVAKLGLDLTASEIVLHQPCGLSRPDRRTGVHAAKALGIRNDLATAPGTSGGYFVPTSMASSVDLALLDYSGVLQAATVLTTATGEEIKYPTANDTSNKASQIGEGSLISTTSVDPTIGSLSLRSYDYQSGFIRVSNRVLRDSAFDLESLIGQMLGERHGRRLNTDCTTGAGAAGPTGIVTSSVLGKTTAGATAITFNEIIDLKHSVDPAYRPGASFMMSDGVFLYVSKLTASGTGEYLLQPDATQAVGFRAHGAPIVINQDMQATVATATKTMLYGALSKFIVRRVAGIRIVRAAERFLEYDQTAFIAFMSYDSGLLDAGTNPVKHMLQA